MPPSGNQTYYGLRALAGRAVFLHSALGGVVLTNPRAGLRYEEMVRDLRPLYAGAGTEDIVRVARKYGASHMLMEAGGGSVPRSPARLPQPPLRSAGHPTDRAVTAKSA